MKKIRYLLFVGVLLMISFGCGNSSYDYHKKKETLSSIEEKEEYSTLIQMYEKTKTEFEQELKKGVSKEDKKPMQILLEAWEEYLKAYPEGKEEFRKKLNNISGK